MKEKNKTFLKNYWWIIVILLILFGWYQIRPSILYSKCHREAEDRAINRYIEKAKLGVEGYSWVYALHKAYIKDNYDLYYKECLRKYGINK